jgi:hypothetical protein
MAGTALGTSRSTSSMTYCPATVKAPTAKPGCTANSEREQPSATSPNRGTTVLKSSVVGLKCLAAKLPSPRIKTHSCPTNRLHIATRDRYAPSVPQELSPNVGKSTEVMANMLLMSAFEVCDPVEKFILMKTHNFRGDSGHSSSHGFHM